MVDIMSKKYVYIYIYISRWSHERPPHDAKLTTTSLDTIRNWNCIMFMFMFFNSAP